MRAKREVQQFIVASRSLYQYLAQGKALCAQDMEIITCCLDELASAAKRALHTGRQCMFRPRSNDGLVHSQDSDQLGHIPPVRILLVDDHKLVRESLRAFSRAVSGIGSGGGSQQRRRGPTSCPEAHANRGGDGRQYAARKWHRGYEADQEYVPSHRYRGFIHGCGSAALYCDESGRRLELGDEGNHRRAPPC